mgnify:FL=1
MKTCPKCKGEMKLIEETRGALIKDIESIPTNPYESIHKTAYYAQIYVCTECGFVEQYVPHEYLDKIF